MYVVYEVFPDGKRFFRFENENKIDCEVYVNNNKYDCKKSKLIIEKEFILPDEESSIEYWISK